MGLTTIVIDTETTGLDVKKAKIIEVAAVAVKNNMIIGTFSSLVKNDLSGAGDALEVNGITVEEVESAPSPQEVYNTLCGFLSMYAPFKFTAFYIPFDKSILESNGWDFTNASGDPPLWGKDLKELAKEKLQDKKPTNAHYRWPKLVQATEVLGIEHVDAHRALSDAVAAAKMMIILKQR